MALVFWSFFMKLLLTIILSLNVAFAQQIKPISKNDRAPFDGFVIDKQFEQDRRKDRELLELEKDKNRVLRELGKVRVGREDFYRKEAEKAKSEAVRQQWKTVLYFVGGVLLGGASVYLGSKVAK